MACQGTDITLVRQQTFGDLTKILHQISSWYDAPNFWLVWRVNLPMNIRHAYYLSIQTHVFIDNPLKITNELLLSEEVLGTVGEPSTHNKIETTKEISQLFLKTINFWTL